MENNIKIEFRDQLGHVNVNGKKISMVDTANVFRTRMLNTLLGMENGKVSRAIKIIIKEVEP